MSIFRDKVVVDDLEFNNTNFGNVTYGCDILDGWDDSAEPTVLIQSFGYSDGVASADRYPLKEKYIEIGGWVRASSRRDAELAKAKIRSLFGSGKEIQVIRHGAIPQRYSVRTSQKVEFPVDLAEQGFRWLTQIMAPWPFRLGVTESFAEAASFTGSGFFRTYDASAGKARRYHPTPNKPGHWSRTYVEQIDGSTNITSQTWENLLTNPSFRTTSGVVEVWRNLLTNPSFEATSGTVEVRRNHYIRPLMTDATGVGGVNGSTVTSVVGTPKLQIAAPAGGITDSGANFFQNLLSVAAGDVVTYSFDVTGVIADSWRISVQGVAASVVHINNGPTLVPAGQTVRIWATATFTASGTPGLFLLRSNAAIASTAHVSRPLAEKSPVVGDYFDHLVSPDPDLTPSATGTPNASPSVLTGVGVATVAGGSGRFAISSTQWAASGARSLRIISTGTGADAYPAVAHTFAAGDVGKTFTVLASVRLSAPTTGNTHTDARRIYLSGQVAKSDQAPNVAGVHDLRATFTVTAAGNQIRFGGGGSAGGGDVWWDNLALVEGVYTGPAFSGSNSPDPDLVPAWIGTQDASVSTLSAPGVVGASGALKIWKTSNGLKATVPGSPAAWRVGIQGGFPATPHTVMMRVRTTWTGFIRPSAGGPANSTGETLLPVQAGVWTNLVGSVIGGSNPTGVVGRSGDGYSLGDTVEIEYALVVAGDYFGTYFDGSFQSVSESIQYFWSGTVDASTSTMIQYTKTATQDPLPDTIIVNNNGDADAYPRFEIQGPLPSSTWYIINDATGETMSFDSTINAGQILEVNTLDQTAYIGGVPVDYYIRGTWMRLAPGSNPIRLVTAGEADGARLRVYSYDTWR